MLFELSTVELAVGLFVLIGGAAGAGVLVGDYLRERRPNVKESSGVLQGALLGFMGLVLAFGLSLALGRYESRRTALVDDANTIGTTYLRAQTLPDPVRTRAQSVLKQYAEVESRLTDTVPGSEASDDLVAEGVELQRRLWAGAVTAVHEDPEGTAPRLYEESLNEMIDQQSVRVAGLGNRVPTEVLMLELLGAALAMFLLGLHVGVLGRNLVPVLLAAGLVTGLLFVSFDLDRPARGLIQIPDGALDSLITFMDEPPVAEPGP